MYPVQSPHKVRSQMNWSTLAPVIVDIVAHILDQLGDEMRTYRFMFAACNGNAARSIISSIGANPSQCFPLQSENQRRTKLERAPLQGGLNCIDRSIILPEPISGFRGSFLLRVSNEFRFESTAVTPLPLLTRHLLSLANLSASRSTISRVISSFS